MNEQRKIETEEVDAVAPPPKARVDLETPAETFERKRDYLAGFLDQQPEAAPRAVPAATFRPRSSRR